MNTITCETIENLASVDKMFFGYGRLHIITSKNVFTYDPSTKKLVPRVSTCKNASLSFLFMSRTHIYINKFILSVLSNKYLQYDMQTLRVVQIKEDEIPWSIVESFCVVSGSIPVEIHFKSAVEYLCSKHRVFSNHGDSVTEVNVYQDIFSICGFHSIACNDGKDYVFVCIKYKLHVIHVTRDFTTPGGHVISVPLQQDGDYGKAVLPQLRKIRPHILDEDYCVYKNMIIFYPSMAVRVSLGKEEEKQIMLTADTMIETLIKKVVLVFKVNRDREYIFFRNGKPLETKRSLADQGVQTGTLIRAVVFNT